MHLDGDLHAMIGGELAMRLPVRRNDLVPLPFKDFQKVRRPGASDPVGKFGVGAVTGAAGKIHHRVHAQFFSQQDGFSRGVGMFVGDRLVGMQRVAVARQRRNGEARVGDLAFEGLQLGRIVQHGQLGMGVARIIAGAEFHRVDIQRLELLQHGVERQA